MMVSADMASENDLCQGLGVGGGGWEFGVRGWGLGVGGGG